MLLLLLCDLQNVNCDGGLVRALVFLCEAVWFNLVCIGLQVLEINCDFYVKSNHGRCTGCDARQQKMKQLIDVGIGAVGKQQIYNSSHRLET